MLISLNWIRDYVDVPQDVDPRNAAECFTRTTAEVDDVRPIKVDARGLIIARVLSISELPGTRNLRLVVLDVGHGRTVEAVTAAPALMHDIQRDPERCLETRATIAKPFAKTSSDAAVRP